MIMELHVGQKKETVYQAKIQRVCVCLCGCSSSSKLQDASVGYVLPQSRNKLLAGIRAHPQCLLQSPGC